MNNISDILWRNQGQVLTPELIFGISHAATPPPAPNTSLLDQYGAQQIAVSGVTFQVDRLADIVDEIAPHHQAQWNEVEVERTDWNPDYQQAALTEAAGKYVLFTARRDGKLIGNMGCYLYHSLHNQKLSAKEDTMYLVPEERRGSLAIRFIQYCEDVLLMYGVEQITVTVKTSRDVGKLWERRGYAFTDRVLTKSFSKRP